MASPAPAAPPPPGGSPPGAPSAYPTPAPAYPAPGPWTGGPGYSGFPPGYPMAAPPLSPQVDGAAMGDILIAAIILFIGAIVGFIAPEALGTGYGAALGATPTGLAASTLDALLGVAAVAIVVSLIAYYLFRRAFVRLRTVDSRFESTPTFALLVMIGLVLLLPGLVAIISLEISILNCAAGARPIPTTCVTDLGALLGGVVLLLIAGILALVGYIGVLVGIWRLGTRYDESMFKVAAVLIIFPYLNIVGVILLLLGTRRVQARVGSAPPGMPPPVAPYRPM